MGLFDKLFGKKENPSKTSNIQSVEENFDIKNFKVYEINKNELNAIEEFSNYISQLLHFYPSILNSTHILHPENLIKFSQLWFHPENQNRNIDDSTMIEYLGVSLGKYIQDTTNFNWCNVADLRTTKNGNINSECALINSDNNTLFIPIKVFKKEIYEEKGYINKELNRIINLENFKETSKIEKKTDSIIYEDIDKLVENAAQSGNGDDLTILWKATLNLKEWHFITKHTSSIEDRKPFIGVIENQSWIFLFTDRNKAQKYCLTEGNEGFTDENGNVYIISMETESAIQYILKLHENGIFGMRINEGNGWFSPIENLNSIIDFVKNR